jgi:hypothetical protein
MRATFTIYLFLALMMGVGGSFIRTAVGEDPLVELQRRVDKLHPQPDGGVSAQAQRVLDRARSQAEAMDQSIEQTAPLPSEGSFTESVPRTHVRGPEGIPFPKPEEIYVDSFLPPPLSPENKMAEALPASQSTKPPRCDSNETKREERPLDDGNKEETTLYEALYLPEELVPVDIAEVYGTKVKLYPYGVRSGTGGYIRMRADAVPCVPYRIRITNRAWYLDRGNNAFKNFDREPGGKGELSNWIRQKLSIKK